MFDHLVRFLTGADGGLQSGQQNDAAFALAVLLIEVARSDDRVEAREQSLIALALARRFGLDRSEVASLVAAAKEGAIKATDLHHFTQVVVGSFNEEERIGVIEMLWDVAYSDSVLTGDEDALIRRVAGLIYVSDWERGEAKRRITQRSEDGRHQLRELRGHNTPSKHIDGSTPAGTRSESVYLLAGRFGIGDSIWSAAP